ncbi:Pyruvate/Phosphoenolpyruvate kinase-like domain-containing protein [Dunaliella salina]|uniref:pyruvate, phosphate dikinase n=1 Tax=Dunaliella salina TaxID=3046 RepID=A0ABQ7GMT2_DUNSA|nr:Pyruvate/Phosphoenolpyruvate kinase-like domain-containing protein [Dunaliella salina]|eukprot:KAF5839728.1 Pyruvate/Phosphoenolpyruvate kinase-like domain-containing protein [Dunaliella salina]
MFAIICLDFALRGQHSNLHNGATIEGAGFCGDPPGVHAELDQNTRRLEAHLQDMQDSEFTVQDGVLYMLQTRNGKRTGLAALTVAVDMVEEKLITTEKAIMMVEPRHLEQLLHPTFKDEQAYRSAKMVMAKGLAASPGAGVGKVVFTAEDAIAMHRKGETPILCREDTSPDDVGGMNSSAGILTQRGGMTSHAAVVARGWGKPCVCGASLAIDVRNKTLTAKTAEGAIHVLHQGDWMSLNGTTGEVIRGKFEMREPEMTAGNLATFMQWVDAKRKLRVLANADSPEDADTARKHGAEGIGLVRTEHMFFTSPERIQTVQMLIASTELRSPAQAESIAKLQAFQQADFEGLFRSMDGMVVTVRLLDPPLHEFLPHAGPALTRLCKQLAKDLRATTSVVQERLEALREANPMMGLRGCRLGVVHPEISEMQSTAVFEAAAVCIKEGVKVHAEIMIPLGKFRFRFLLIDFRLLYSR